MATIFPEAKLTLFLLVGKFETKIYSYNPRILEALDNGIQNNSLNHRGRTVSQNMLHVRNLRQCLRAPRSAAVVV
jgi:hypothetical protein